MATEVISPRFGRESIAVARDIVKNNSKIVGANVVLHTSETWLPAILSQVGFFTSNGEVKRNRPDFWRDAIDKEIVELSWARIEININGNNKVERRIS